MTDVYIVALSIIGFLITAPGLAVALNLLLPGVTHRAQARLEQTPRVSLIVGLIVAGALALWIFILTQTNTGVLQGVAFVSGLLALGIYSIGAAGMSAVFGERIGHVTGSRSPIGNIVRGAVVLELACFVPLVGWFLFFPFVMSASMGAALFALVGWGPKGPAVPTQPEDPDLTTAAPLRAST